MKLYHGTNMVFDKIDLCKSKPNKDFGQGFYLSPGSRGESPHRTSLLPTISKNEVRPCLEHLF